MTSKTKLHVISFGFRHGVPAEASLVLDVRSIRNPYHDPELRTLTGLDAKVRQQVLSHKMTYTLLDHAQALIDHRFGVEGKQALTLGVGCTGGHHRSVAIAEMLGQWDTYGPVKVTHRDIGKQRSG